MKRKELEYNKAQGPTKKGVNVLRDSLDGAKSAKEGGIKLAKTTEKKKEGSDGCCA